MADQKRRLIIFGCRDEFHPFEAFLEKKFVTSKDSDAKGSQLKGCTNSQFQSSHLAVSSNDKNGMRSSFRLERMDRSNG